MPIILNVFVIVMASFLATMGIASEGGVMGMEVESNVSARLHLRRQLSRVASRTYLKFSQDYIVADDDIIKVLIKIGGEEETSAELAPDGIKHFCVEFYINGTWLGHGSNFRITPMARLLNTDADYWAGLIGGELAVWRVGLDMPLILPNFHTKFLTLPH